MGKVKYEIQFRQADESHVSQIYEIEQAVFPVPWSYETILQDVCEHEIAIYIVGLCNREVVSYAGFWHVMEEAHITNIAVKENHRRRGIGGAMMKLMFSTAANLGVKTMTLEVRASNIAAISMYEKSGFIKAGLRKRYYTDNQEDALVLNISL